MFGCDGGAGRFMSRKALLHGMECNPGLNNLITLTIGACQCQCRVSVSELE